MKNIKYLPLFLLFACNSESTEEVEIDLPEVDNTVDNMEESESTSEVEKKVPVLNSKIDREAMDEITEYSETDAMTIFQIYNQSIDIEEKWTNKFWGRCCSEADMTFSDFLIFDIQTTKSSTMYPLKNMLDYDYKTTYVFRPENEVSIRIKLDPETRMYTDNNKKMIDILHEKDTLIHPFQISLINGYTKSEETYNENYRLKEVELWLNGEHKCNCILEDTPEAQIVFGNFPFFKNDVVELKPIAFYNGSKYKDVCISEIQFNLGAITHPAIDEDYSIWGE